MGRRILALLLVSVAFVSAACRDIIGPSKTALHFDGTVTAQTTGQPVAGALIQLADPTIFWGVRASGITDAQGHYSLSYSIENCSDGDFFGITLTASGSGLTSKTVTPACTESAQRVDFSLAVFPTP